MGVNDSSEKERNRLAVLAGITVTAAHSLSGADLHRKAMLNVAGNPATRYLDGARLAQLTAGSGL